MRSLVAGAALCVLGVTSVAAADVLSPTEIKATFGTGTAFAAVNPNGKIYSLILKPDGTAMETAKGSTSATTGTWRVSSSGYCSKWGTSAENCYTVERNGDKFDVRDNKAKVVSRWSLLP